VYNSVLCQMVKWVGSLGAFLPHTIPRFSPHRLLSTLGRWGIFLFVTKLTPFSNIYGSELKVVDGSSPFLHCPRPHDLKHQSLGAFLSPFVQDCYFSLDRDNPFYGRFQMLHCSGFLFFGLVLCPDTAPFPFVSPTFI
jgi:hypothetical protein